MEMDEQQIQQQQAVGALLQNPSDTSQYLTFMLAGEEYGLNILNVQEIKGWEGVTPIPNMPGHILGIINLRGTVVPIIDLRRCFALEENSFGATTVVIMVKVETESEQRVVGIVVDAVSEVYNVNMAEVEPAPTMSTIVTTEYIKGLTTVQDKMVILLDISKLIETETSSEELAALA